MKKVKTVAICLPDEQIEFIDDVACQWVCSRSAVIKRIIADRMHDVESDELKEVKYEPAPGIGYHTLQELNETEFREYVEGLNDGSKTHL